MLVDVNTIENNIYTKICEAFAEFAEKKLERYKSVLEFLRVTEIEKIISNTTNQVYDYYCEFCESVNCEPLAHTVFSRTVCECGFTTYHQVKQVNGKRKKFIYFKMD
ncbi:hypothetical protein [Alkaliphilus serpentinus]|uniref:Uncharacterized protein n=1 Tax=Alkaliphilus serpentinus TaxID=1482731 RepID=A0A833HM17_9FIRM|nr:hypothetical protein [Alkaliphilus serpentinus]KAB3527115.1 hypothetical protein F8153_13165 [Alkaliphilus serpentinus]